ncbi:MAG: gamma-glutamylcyclotransferase [Gammaproteobacteria bacterium]|nr:gamma-glutamylcyclotransferase [Gammaproteobacteria bacterium]MBU0786456.1 gamma-glutamylcyclotransferase [Gammaproteobacteria bacterium]MBU0816159.1 gamma-glutamylcyclotransferase [Gammaproteobacteria bacterium]MBU1787815.1 gamma-glutamylcyclotransferase [Gammaproteobacteria bacterium]
MPEALRTTAVDESARHVLVYGTLRRGDVRDINRLAPAPCFVGMGTITGVMYHLGSYPGVMLGRGGEVLGEVYAIEPALERVLDEIEEVLPEQLGEYRKQQVRVTLDERHIKHQVLRQIDCLVYEVNPAYAQGKPRISSGDWIKSLTTPGR